MRRLFNVTFRVGWEYEYWATSCPWTICDPSQRSMSTLTSGCARIWTIHDWICRGWTQWTSMITWPPNRSSWLSTITSILTFIYKSFVWYANGTSKGVYMNFICGFFSYIALNVANRQGRLELHPTISQLSNPSHRKQNASLQILLLESRQHRTKTTCDTLMSRSMVQKAALFNVCDSQVPFA